ncbi:MAG: DUF1080 domain-containing protein [Rhodothermales bacterium]|nr:DUF1080 domain-containing protein [Rhodothermales bacterium]
MHLTIKPICVALAGVVLLLGCQTPQESGPEPTHNVLSVDEAEEGWELLFDGSSLDSWRGYKWTNVPPNWTVEDGAITCSPCVGGDASLPGDWKSSNDLITKEQFQNFDLRLEWRISPAGNSGIFYRVLEAYDFPYTTGPEFQILDNRRHKDSLNGPKRHAGAAYDVYAPASDATKPAGQWNTARILVDSTHVEHWINGTKVVEYVLFSDEWEERVASSKWAPNPDYGRMKTGHIGLQDHDDAVWYRNIRIKRLPNTRDLP